MEKQTMRWNSDQEAYFGTTSDRKAIRVEGIEMAEVARDAGVDVGELSSVSANVEAYVLNPTMADLLDPDVWQACVGSNQNVSYVK
jgi:hypothetical protein